MHLSGGSSTHLSCSRLREEQHCMFTVLHMQHAAACLTKVGVRQRLKSIKAQVHVLHIATAVLIVGICTTETFLRGLTVAWAQGDSRKVKMANQGVQPEGRVTADSKMQGGAARGSLTDEACGGIDLGTGAVVGDCDVHAALGGGLALHRTQQLFQSLEVLIRVGCWWDLCD